MFEIQTMTFGGQWESPVSHDYQFKSQKAAELAIDELVRVCGWNRAELRIKEIRRA